MQSLEQYERMDDMLAGNILVGKKNEYLQCAFNLLTLPEWKLVNYFLSKYNPEDAIDKRYSIRTSDFYEHISENIPIDQIILIAKGAADKSWWTQRDDGWYYLVRWFDKVETIDNNSILTVTFHKTIASYLPYLKELYASVYVYQMICLYSPRLYNLFRNCKSDKLYFEFGTGTVNDICIASAEYGTNDKVVINKAWKDWNYFNGAVLAPAINDINKVTDIEVAYTQMYETLSGKKTSKVSSVCFNIRHK